MVQYLPPLIFDRWALGATESFNSVARRTMSDHSPSSLLVSVSQAVFKVSVPPTLLPLKVSLPVSSFKSAPVGSTSTLHDRLRHVETCLGITVTGTTFFPKFICI